MDLPRRWRETAYEAGRSCVRLLEEQNPGRMAAVQYDQEAGLSIGSVDLAEAVKPRTVEKPTSSTTPASM